MVGVTHLITWSLHGKEGEMKLNNLIFTAILISSSVGASFSAQAQQATDFIIDQSTQIELLNGATALDAMVDPDQIDQSIFPVFHSLSIRTPAFSGISGEASMVLHSANNSLSNSDFSTMDSYENATQLRARATYFSEFENGGVNMWMTALWQEREVRSLAQGVNTSDESFGYNLGVDFNYAAFNLMGTYYDGEAIDILYFNPRWNNASCLSTVCESNKQEGYMLRGAYFITKATSLGISYSESTMQIQSGLVDGANSELWSIGLYHEVNSWLKLIAEYNEISSSNYSFDEDMSSISLGGSIRW
jgi:hypothetical protein